MLIFKKFLCVPSATFLFHCISWHVLNLHNVSWLFPFHNMSTNVKAHFLDVEELGRWSNNGAFNSVLIYCLKEIDRYKSRTGIYIKSQLTDQTSLIILSGHLIKFNTRMIFTKLNCLNTSTPISNVRLALIT